MRMPSGAVRVAVTVVAVTVLVLSTPAAGEAGAAGPPPELSRWGWPTGPPHQLLRPFEAPLTRYSAGHRGIDVAAVAGAPVFAASDGVVSFSGTVVDRPVLSVKHDGGLVSSIEPVAATVAAGDVVRAGDIVGAVASGGHCDGRCVHFGVRLHGEYVNPLALLAAVQRAVLLPLGR